MNAHANEVLSNIRKTLQTELEGSNVQDVSLTEEEAKFCEEGVALAKKLGFELEGFEGASTDDVKDALEAVLEDEDTSDEMTEQIETLLSKYYVVEDES